MVSLNRRSGNRFKEVGMIESFNFQSENKVVEIDYPMEVSLRDISMGGIGVKSNTNFDIGITLSMNLQIEGNSYVVIGKIIWCRERDGYYDSGLKLIYMPEPLVDYLMIADEESSKYHN